MQIISIANQKGGTGKSTTALALIWGLSKQGKKILAIDLDPQANLSFILGANEQKAGAFELLCQKCKLSEAIQHTKYADVITGKMELSVTDTVLKGNNRTSILKPLISEFEALYDVVIIDTPPTLGTLLLNALAISTGVIIPIHADVLSVQGLKQLIPTIQDCKSRSNPQLEILGVLFTRHSTRTIITREFTSAITDYCASANVSVFETTIRDGIAIREAQALKENLFDYAPKSKPAEDYWKIINELSI